MTSGAPAPGAKPIPGTPSGLLEASYDTFTVDFGFTPNERTEIGGYYTYEKNASDEPVVHDHGGYRHAPLSLNNLLNYDGTDKGNTFGAQREVPHRPREVDASRSCCPSQKVDGLMDITANETGSLLHPGPHDAHSPGAGRRRGHHRLRRHEADDRAWRTLPTPSPRRGR